MNKKIIKMIVIGGFVVAGMGFGPAVFAYEIQDLSDAPVKNDFVLGPGKIELFMDPGDETSKDLMITNRRGETMNFRVEIEDFRGSRDPQQSIVLLGQEKGPYSLRDYVKPEVMEFSLTHGQRMVLPVKISIPEDAEPGGLYGSILFRAVSPLSELAVEQEKAKGQVSVEARLGCLFFVRISGDVKEDGSLKDLTVAKRFYEKTPIVFNLLFENNSSIHLAPYGIIEIKNLMGRKIDEINVDPWFVMPDSLRTKEVKWEKKVLFGRYIATAAINRGYDDIIDQKSVTFWIIPWKPIAVGVAALLLIAFFLRWIAKNFEVKRKSG